MDEQIKHDFESFALPKDCNTSWKNGRYVDNNIQIAWLSWNASRDHYTPALPKNDANAMGMAMMSLFLTIILYGHDVEEPEKIVRELRASLKRANLQFGE